MGATGRPGLELRCSSAEQSAEHSATSSAEEGLACRGIMGHGPRSLGGIRFDCGHYFRASFPWAEKAATAQCPLHHCRQTTPVGVTAVTNSGCLAWRGPSVEHLNCEWPHITSISVLNKPIGFPTSPPIKYHQKQRRLSVRSSTTHPFAGVAAGGAAEQKAERQGPPRMQCEQCSTRSETLFTSLLQMMSCGVWSTQGTQSTSGGEWMSTKSTQGLLIRYHTGLLD
ncbi:hypothetical protein B0T13DRAFT_171627 [Neurospora crassa]|nr:hypothetical protein B0T13DRAFT_171627 [Neurospora crassa]